MNIKNYGLLVVMLACLLLLGGCDDTEKQRDAAIKEAKTAKAELEVAKMALREVNKYNEKLRENIDGLHEKLKANKSKASHSQALEQKLDRYESDILKLTEERDSAIEQHDEILASLEKLQEELTEKNAELSELEKWADQAQETIEQLQKQSENDDEQMPEHADNVIDINDPNVY